MEFYSDENKLIFSLHSVKEHRNDLKYLSSIFTNTLAPYSTRWRAKLHMTAIEILNGLDAGDFLNHAKKDLLQRIEPHNELPKRNYALHDTILLGKEKPIKLEPILESCEDVIIHPRYWTDPILISVYNTDPSETLRETAGKALGYSRARIAFHKAKRNSPFLWDVEDILRLKFLKGSINSNSK